MLICCCFLEWIFVLCCMLHIGLCLCLHVSLRCTTVCNSSATTEAYTYQLHGIGIHNIYRNYGLCYFISRVCVSASTRAALLAIERFLCAIFVRGQSYHCWPRAQESVALLHAVTFGDHDLYMYACMHALHTLHVHFVRILRGTVSEL